MKKLINALFLLIATSTVAWAAIGGTPLSLPPGSIIQFAGPACPAGYLDMPTAAANISRGTYGALFQAIGTAWGAGDGSTTFGSPWLAADYALVQENANIATATTGVIKAHTHTLSIYGAAEAVSPTLTNGGTSAANPGTATTASTGGTANLAAGIRVSFCVKT